MGTLKKALFCLLYCLGSVASAGEGALTLAVHPFLPVAEIEARFKPLAEYLGMILQRPIDIRIGRDYQGHIDAIGGDLVDIAFLGPVPYIEVTKKYGRKPLLARLQVRGEPNLYGVIAIRKGSPQQTLTDLAPARFAFVDSESTMGHIVPRRMLMEAGLPQGLPAQYQFLGSHHNVAIGILAGDYDAGAMKREVFEQFESKGLRALAVSPGVPDHLFVTRSDLASGDIERLRRAMLGLREFPEGIEILRQLHPGLTALVPAADSEYDGLRTTIQAVEAAGE